MTPKVSIVFTSYNHKEFLKQALDSLLNQSFKEFELIIVDDCSTDGSQDILRSYTDPRIRLYLNAKNSGSYVKSSNFGATKAHAPYIIFAQCDDWAEPTQLECLVRCIETYDVGVVFSCSNMVDENGIYLCTDYDLRAPSFRKKCNSDTVVNKEDAMGYLLDSCIIPNLSAALVKKTLYEELNGFSEEYLVLADWDFWLRVSLRSDIYYIRKSLNNFRQHSATIRSSIKMKKQLKELFYMFVSFEKKSGLPRKILCSHLAKLWVRWRCEGLKQWLSLSPYFIWTGVKYSWHFPFFVCNCLFREVFTLRKVYKLLFVKFCS